MSSEQKARAMIAIAKEHGWTGSWETDPETEYAGVVFKRNSERLEISWINNQLTGPPKYEFAGTTANLHSAAVAKRHLTGQPDMDLAVRRMRKQKAVTEEDAEVIDATKHDLPFDLIESTNKEILLACRGAVLIYKNPISGRAERVYIDGRKNRNFNKNYPVYFISRSSAGRRALNFIEGGGMFRAVGLDTILQVQ